MNEEQIVIDAADAARDVEREKARVIDKVLFELSNSTVARRVLKAAKEGDVEQVAKLLTRPVREDAVVTVDRVDSTFCLMLTLTWKKWDRGKRGITVGCGV